MLLSGVSRALEHEPRALMSAQKDSLEGGRFAASVRANKEVYGSEPCNTALFDPSIISDCDGPQHCQDDNTIQRIACRLRFGSPVARNRAEVWEASPVIHG